MTAPATHLALTRSGERFGSEREMEINQIRFETFVTLNKQRKYVSVLIFTHHGGMLLGIGRFPPGGFAGPGPTAGIL